LEDASSVTHLTLHDSLQRNDNVPLFNALKNLITSDKCKLQHLRLIEPQVQAANYKRWCFKRTGFLHHCYQVCRDRDIHLVIDATLILETREGEPQDVTSWLLTHFPKTIREDKDITSLKCQLTALPGDKQVIPDVFRALCDLMSNCKRRWKSIQVDVLYAGAPKNATSLTELLMEVGDLYRVPLTVQWDPMDATAADSRGTWSSMTLAAQDMMREQNGGGTLGLPAHVLIHKALEDTTDSTELDRSVLSVL
jgi:hypothetical protein